MKRPDRPLPDAIDSLPVYDKARTALAHDWLVRPVATKAGVYRSADGQCLVLANGLIARTFKVAPNLATVSFALSGDDTEFVSAVKPEALVALDGRKYEIGGLKGQPAGQ